MYWWMIIIDSGYCLCVLRIFDFKFMEDGFDNVFRGKIWKFFQNFVYSFFCVISRVVFVVLYLVIKCLMNFEEISLNIFKFFSGFVFVIFKVIVGYFLLGSVDYYVFNEDYQFGQFCYVVIKFSNKFVKDVLLVYIFWQSCYFVQVQQVVV